MKLVFALFAFLIAATLTLASTGFVFDDRGIIAFSGGLFLVGTIVLSTTLGVKLLEDKK